MAKFHSGFRQQQRDTKHKQQADHRKKLAEFRKQQLDRQASETIAPEATAKSQSSLPKNDHEKTKYRKLKQQYTKLQKKLVASGKQNLQLSQQLNKQKRNANQTNLQQKLQAKDQQLKDNEQELQQKEAVIKRLLAEKSLANDEVLAIHEEMQRTKANFTILARHVKPKLAADEHQKQVQSLSNVLIGFLANRYLGQKTHYYQLSAADMLKLFREEIKNQETTKAEMKTVHQENQQLKIQIKAANQANLNRQIISNRFESLVNFNVEHQLHRVSTKTLLETLMTRVGRADLSEFDLLERLYDAYMRRVEPQMAQEVENQDPQIRFGFIHITENVTTFTDVNFVIHYNVKNPKQLELVNGNAYRGRLVQDDTELVLEKALPFFKRRLERVAHHNHKQRLSTNKVMPEVKSALDGKQVLIATWKRNFDYKEYLKPFGVITTVADTAEIKGDRLAMLAGAKRFDLVFCDTGGMHHSQVAIMDKSVPKNKLIHFYRLNTHDMVGALLSKFGLYPQLTKYGFATGENKGYW
ncbi:hypothetical protein PDA01_11130 [Pediococcus damnosus]|uniref:hypothetical protein n=1 Tax=Pediococcus damnosus TaxID=51663 RepID=UPI00114385D9|nr:hypothetical protein [Pediococcus damnosus]GEA93220.1 hypothetical protein PDA01_11130 [Pediococcus damnosus]